MMSADNEKISIEEIHKEIDLIQWHKIHLLLKAGSYPFML